MKTEMIDKITGRHIFATDKERGLLLQIGRADLAKSVLAEADKGEDEEDVKPSTKNKSKHDYNTRAMKAGK